jgi:hypothetical protein
MRNARKNSRLLINIILFLKKNLLHLCNAFGSRDDALNGLSVQDLKLLNFAIFEL